MIGHRNFISDQKNKNQIRLHIVLNRKITNKPCNNNIYAHIFIDFISGMVLILPLWALLPKSANLEGKKGFYYNVITTILIILFYISCRKVPRIQTNLASRFCLYILQMEKMNAMQFQNFPQACFFGDNF